MGILWCPSGLQCGLLYLSTLQNLEDKEKSTPEAAHCVFRTAAKFPTSLKDLSIPLGQSTPYMQSLTPNRLHNYRSRALSTALPCALLLHPSSHCPWLQLHPTPLCRESYFLPNEAWMLFISILNKINSSQKKFSKEYSLVPQSCNPGLQKAEAGGSLNSKPGLHNEFEALSQNKTK